MQEVCDGVLFAIVVSRRRLPCDDACSTMAFVSWMIARQRVSDFRAFLVVVSRRTQDSRGLHGQEVVVWLCTLRRWRKNGGGADRRCHETTRLTCTGGCTTLASLQEGGEYAVAFFCHPAIVLTHSRLLGEVGHAGNSSIIRQGPVT